MGEAFRTIITLALIIATAWFNFVIINTTYTLIKCKKRDHELKFIFNMQGKLFYIALTVLYIVGLIGGIIVAVIGVIKSSQLWWLNGLSVVTFVSLFYCFFFTQIIMVGRKYIMIGRMQIDYRKLKKVNYSYDNKMSFVYAQHDYHFSTRWVDTTDLKKRISK